MLRKVVFFVLFFFLFPSVAFAQYADCSTCQKSVVTEACGGACGGTSDQYHTYVYTYCKGTTTLCSQVCAFNTSCTGNPCSQSINCSWSSVLDCQGGSCGCGQIRTAVEYCNGVHCQDACTADSSCNAGGCGNVTNPTNTPGGPTSTPTPAPIGTIQARAVQVTGAASCATIEAVPTTDSQINGTIHQFTSSSAGSPPPQTQSGANYVTFSNVVTGSYTLAPILPSANWVVDQACWTNETTGASGTGFSATFAGGQTLRWDVGYTYGTAWTQTQGGDAYASGVMKSYIPLVTPRVFNLDGASNYPGVVLYGTDYDFDPDTSSKGPSLVSSTNWLVNASRTTTDYYQVFYNRFGAPTTATTAVPFNNLAGVTQPASNCSPTSCPPYYVVGDMTTTGAWSVGATDNIVILVNGNLTIGGPITVAPGGFLAFIVHGNITVANTVGTAYNSTADQVDGVYIASTATQTGTFDTGYSTAAGTARFVGIGVSRCAYVFFYQSPAY